MISESIVSALLGGALIGLSVTIMLLFSGRVTGISGILASSLATPSREGLWRWFFLFGLITGGYFVHEWRPELFENVSGRDVVTVSIAGILVGFGTVMGNGCTSGHGVCGISRLSIRSILATVTFILFGILSATAFRFFSGGMS